MRKLSVGCRSGHSGQDRTKSKEFFIGAVKPLSKSLLLPLNPPLGGLLVPHLPERPWAACYHFPF